jgi:hypothetical protein
MDKDSALWISFMATSISLEQVSKVGRSHSIPWCPSWPQLKQYRPDTPKKNVLSRHEKCPYCPWYCFFDKVNDMRLSWCMMCLSMYKDILSEILKRTTSHTLGTRHCSNSSIRTTPSMMSFHQTSCTNNSFMCSLFIRTWFINMTWWTTIKTNLG